MLFEAAMGRWSGEGRWRDETGATHSYAVVMTFDPEPDSLRLSFRHVFVEEETPDVLLDLTLHRTAPGVLRFEVPALPPGRGYVTADTLSYTIPIPGNAVQATCHLGPGGLTVTGSSERNSAGHFVMWEERLIRA